MKKLTLLLFVMISFTNWSQMTIEWRFLNVEDGYDHINKMKIYIDGEYHGETDECNQLDWCTYEFPLSKGNHNIKLLNMSLFEGVWEEHLIENNYSVDAVLEKSVKMKKKAKLKMEIDLDNSGEPFTFLKR